MWKRMILCNDPPLFRARAYAVCADKAVAIVAGFTRHSHLPSYYRRTGISTLPLASTCPQDSPLGKVHREQKSSTLSK